MNGSGYHLSVLKGGTDLATGVEGLADGTLAVCQPE